MKIPFRSSGIISYAGLQPSELLTMGQRAQEQADLPERLRSLLPIFPVELVVDMPYEGSEEKTSDLGFRNDADTYHSLLSREWPHLYAGENRIRCFRTDGTFRGGVVAVDEVWAAAFAQYRPFLGERLTVHLIGGGHQAVAVPQSLAGSLSWYLDDCELALGITHRAQHYCAWLLGKMEAGDKRTTEKREAAYLKENRLAPFCADQEELAHTMQDLSILNAIQNGGPAPLYTEVSRLASQVGQYAPFRRACDVFEEAVITRQTSRLAQLFFEGDTFQSDFWFPWIDALVFIDRESGSLDIRALCEAFQIAPAVDADGRGGVYPSALRVVTVVDRSLHPMVAGTVNNPAYGSGKSPAGNVNKLVFLPNSADLLANGSLLMENHTLNCINTRLTEEELLAMRAMAETQEHRGRLMDALYRRESVLGRMQAGSIPYDRARALLDARVEAAQAWVSPEAEAAPSGDYGADIAYLKRLAAWREGTLADQPFEDPRREVSIESGFAMRARLVREDAPTQKRDRSPKPAPQPADNPQYVQMDFLGR